MSIKKFYFSFKEINFLTNAWIEAHLLEAKSVKAFTGAGLLHQQWRTAKSVWVTKIKAVDFLQGTQKNPSWHQVANTPHTLNFLMDHVTATWYRQEVTFHNGGFICIPTEYKLRINLEKLVFEYQSFITTSYITLTCFKGHICVNKHVCLFLVRY